ncbi:1,4-dihydroxy-2-naphthoate polyprenyltransferase [Cutibacterium sp. WCA-380-WT-3A]|uniref:1,4-dihydroxy-2-naphthoate octaprenyltransferase n=1 Tax=Cutibacterium porci TaxID=2605781 RepID=A0A7K0J8C3_9ACTN|nr:1,4-dihydroxy-2-naphthoate polyprenyltransferase [Cutibacterium porci]MSS46190.1 1,4-dihydroxy-2-naphthoate polyprenyltransferase [Cutibacterium porci]
MATAAEWLEGARPRTLPTAISPVLAGTAIAISDGGARWGLAVLCLVVALGLVIGVNFANDYSDGIRGSDGEDRVGPLRLVGSGVAEPSRVKAAAFGCFGVSAVAGLVITIITGHWWFIIVGLACILAAWFYTGGPHPYGYAGLGEVFVFVFFGLVAVGGTVYVQTDHVGAAGWVTASLIGFLACAVLVANNLRDIDGDRISGKRTLETRLGAQATRVLYLVLVFLACVGVILAAGMQTWWFLLGLGAVIFLAPTVRAMIDRVTGMSLVPVLRNTGLAELLCAVGFLAGATLDKLL